MKTRIFALGLAVLLVFTMLAGCSDGNSGAGSDSSTGSSQPAPAQQEYPITVNDVEIKEAPTSVVTLSPLFGGCDDRPEVRDSAHRPQRGLHRRGSGLSAYCRHRKKVSIWTS